RSKSFYCIAAALLSIKVLEKALEDTIKYIKNEEIDKNDLKTKSRILKENLTKCAEDKSIELKLKRK
ncbi:MAG: hypothetical protein ACFFCL_09910, partial [Promethearchaeota archaeon]